MLIENGPFSSEVNVILRLQSVSYVNPQNDNEQNEKIVTFQIWHLIIPYFVPLNNATFLK